jgi:hypothetical protein
MVRQTLDEMGKLYMQEILKAVDDAKTQAAIFGIDNTLYRLKRYEETLTTE